MNLKLFEQEKSGIKEIILRKKYSIWCDGTAGEDLTRDIAPSPSHRKVFMVSRFIFWGIINGYHTIYYQCLVYSSFSTWLKVCSIIALYHLKGYVWKVHTAVLFRETEIRLAVFTGTPVSLQTLSHLFIQLFPEPCSSLPRELLHHMDKPTETLHTEADQTPPVSWFMWKKQVSLCCQEPRNFQFGDQELDEPMEKQPTFLPLKGAARQHEAVCRGAGLWKACPVPWHSSVPRGMVVQPASKILYTEW